MTVRVALKPRLNQDSSTTEHPGGEKIGNSVERYNLGFLASYTLEFLFNRTLISMEQQ